MANRGTAADFAAQLDAAIEAQRSNGTCAFCDEVPQEIRDVITNRVRPRLDGGKPVPWAAIRRALQDVGYTITVAKLGSHFRSRHFAEGRV